MDPDWDAGARRTQVKIGFTVARHQTSPPPVVGNVISLLDYHGLNHAFCSHYRIKGYFMRTITSSGAKNISRAV